MLVKQFPDINWLKAKIKENFRDKMALNGVQLKHPGWPSIILNACTVETERKDIKGPFSLFLNRKGISEVTVNGKICLLNEHCFTLSNFGERYDLLVNNQSVTETLNIHFGEHFYFQSLTALSKSDEDLLDDWGSISSTYNLIPKTQYRDVQFNYLVDRVFEAFENQADTLQKEEFLFDLLKHVLIENSKELKRVDNVHTKKASTKTELLSRLYVARDYIHFNFNKPISLDELARVSCLSKFHFLRQFKEVFTVSPYQYIKRLRFEKGLELIRKTNESLEQIADKIGIENGSSLSRLVFQYTRHYPSYFRN